MANTRVKDAGFIQQHIEKLILAVGVLVLLIAFFLFVLSNPFKINLANRDFDDAAGPIEVLNNTDKQLARGLENKKPLNTIALPNYLKDFRDSMRASVVTGEPVREIAFAGLTDSDIDPAPSPAPKYYLPLPPVPKNIVHVAGTDVLETDFDQEIVDAMFDLLGGKRDPADFSMIIVSGEFPVWDWMKSLTEVPSDEELTVIPPGVWAKRFGIAGVFLIREELMSPGVWGNRQIVSALPEQTRILPGDEQPSGDQEAISRIVELRERQAEIARPELPWLKGLVQAAPPVEEELGEGGKGANEFGIVEEGALGPAEKKIKRIEERIAKLEEERARREEKRRPAGPDGEGGGSGKTTSGDKYAREIENLRKQIEKYRARADKEKQDREEALERRRIEEERRLNRGGGAFPGRGNPGGGRPDQPGTASTVDGIQLTEDATVRVWAADPTMRPGKTYRYKLLVSAINPLYAVRRLDPEQLEENKSRAALLPSDKQIEAMPWIEPITVEPTTQFFLSSTGGQSTAKADVFRRVNGQLEKHTFDVSPGDPIGKTARMKNQFDDEDKTVDMSVGAVVVDIEQRLNTAGRPYLAMIYMDEEGNLFEKSLEADKNNEQRKELEIEVKEGRQEWPLRGDAGDRDDDVGGGGRFERDIID